MASKRDTLKMRGVPKTPTGIKGLDDITNGGFPAGRPTLICGDAGSGKTLMAVEFLVRGATAFGEPGVFVAFEEKAEELSTNVASLGFDLEKLQRNNLIRIDHVEIDKTQIQETGEYDMDGLFIRLEHAIDSIKAKRVVLDTIENLFGGLTNEGIIRAELRRLFGWLKDKGVAAVITGERGERSLTRQGLEEYVSDCVILLEHRVNNKISTRLMRIIKYRGSAHGTNEYPFLIDKDGISVLPITSLQLDANVSTQRISSGIPALDQMLGGKGFYRGSSILISGTAGTGKTSIAACFANESCNRKEKCIYFAFEESPQQIVRNMRSIGMNLQKHIDSGLLQMHSARPTLFGLEMHLVTIHKLIRQFKPKVVVLDPISNLVTIGSMQEVRSMLMRLLDFLLNENVTAMFTSLSGNVALNEYTDDGVTSLVDTWILVRDIESGGERNRGLYIMKSRGMKHSNQVREFVMTDEGLDLVDVYMGEDGILTGSARESKQMLESTGEVLRKYAVDRKDIQIERKRKVLQAKIASLQEEFESAQDELNKSYIEEEMKKQLMEQNRQMTSAKRQNKNSEDGKKK